MVASIAVIPSVTRIHAIAVVCCLLYAQYLLCFLAESLGSPRRVSAETPTLVVHLNRSEAQVPLADIESQVSC